MTQPRNMRLVLTGPESTGKSALTAHLAGRMGLPCASEYARLYLEQHGPDYDYDLLLTIARGHLRHQHTEVPPDARLGVLDTDLINYKIWCEVAYGKCHAEIIAALEQETHHVYLLCFPDLPWEPDPLREHPNDRLMLFERHQRELDRLGRRYAIIRGIGNDRLLAAEAAAAKLILV